MKIQSKILVAALAMTLPALALAAQHRRAAQATDSERQPLLPQVLRAVRAAILPLVGRVAAGWQRPGSAFPRPV